MLKLYKNLIFLNQNQIRVLDSTTFKRLLNLELLYLNFNRLDEIDSSVFDENLKLEMVFLGNNPISLKNPDYVKSLCSNVPGCNIYL